MLNLTLLQLYDDWNLYLIYHTYCLVGVSAVERYQVIPGTTRLGPMHWPGSDHRSGTSTCAVPVQFCSKTQLYSSRLSAHLTTFPPPPIQIPAPIRIFKSSHAIKVSCGQAVSNLVCLVVNRNILWDRALLCLTILYYASNHWIAYV